MIPLRQILSVRIEDLHALIFAVRDINFALSVDYDIMGKLKLPRAIAALSELKQIFPSGEYFTTRAFP